jgi:adenine deaminase
VRRKWLSVARGEVPADLVLKGGQVLSVFTGEVFEANVAITDGFIVGVGDYDGPNTIDVSGKILTPGFIDGHCHIESSKLSVHEFACSILPSGTTSVVVDPHELANVLGIEGIEYLLSASEGVPLGVYVKLPSCVPASSFESPKQTLEACDYGDLLNRDRVVGIAEMMNYPDAIAGEPPVLSKMALTGFRNIDGHAPGVHGRELNAYLLAGPSSDHECTSLPEALEKRRIGMWIMLREASMIRNLVDLLPLIREYGTTNCMFVTDDREAGTLLSEGDVNSMVRTAVQQGLSAADAVKLASLNVARYHGLRDLGAVAPGYKADILVLPDLDSFRPEIVLKAGAVVYGAGQLMPFASSSVPDFVTGTVNVRPVAPGDFAITSGGNSTIRVIELVPDQVATLASTAIPVEKGGKWVVDAETDLLKAAVVERHHATGRIGLGFCRGFGLRRGAFASTVAHDAHNIVIVGANDADMALSVRRLSEIGGGLVVCDEGKVVGELPLQIAGLMSTAGASSVVSSLEELERVLAGMGVRIGTPFMYLSFLALSVIPELRLTDRGLIDVRIFQQVPLGIA